MGRRAQNTEPGFRGEGRAVQKGTLRGAVRKHDLSPAACKPAVGFRLSIFSCLSPPERGNIYRNGERCSAEFLQPGGDAVEQNGHERFSSQGPE